MKAFKHWADVPLGVIYVQEHDQMFYVFPTLAEACEFAKEHLPGSFRTKPSGGGFSSHAVGGQWGFDREKVAGFFREHG